LAKSSKEFPTLQFWETFPNTRVSLKPSPKVIPKSSQGILANPTPPKVIKKPGLIPNPIMAFLKTFP